MVAASGMAADQGSQLAEAAAEGHYHITSSKGGAHTVQHASGPPYQQLCTPNYSNSSGNLHNFAATIVVAAAATSSVAMAAVFSMLLHTQRSVTAEEARSTIDGLVGHYFQT